MFGVLAAIIMLIAGVAGAAFEVRGADTVVSPAWDGVGFALLAIVLGAETMRAQSRIPAALLVICAIAGAILGGTFIAACMALALAGGMLALASPREPAAA